MLYQNNLAEALRQTKNATKVFGVATKTEPLISSHEFQT